MSLIQVTLKGRTSRTFFNILMDQISLLTAFIKTLLNQIACSNINGVLRFEFYLSEVLRRTVKLAIQGVGTRINVDSSEAKK